MPGLTLKAFNEIETEYNDSCETLDAGELFYCFSQNPVAGVFLSAPGVREYVIVEGRSWGEILSRAESIGLYFDGVAKGKDCPCCGDRWYKAKRPDLEDAPALCGSNVRPVRHPYQKPKGFVHYLDGRVVPFVL